ncbi:PP2C family protein-serine/threonine phosphatase [Petropleomorpha daqingensis]|uniref:Serine phosphatase RsbU (Regulator of sigma subunit) n=1 Tax=Petropleomorpha daqingensis TaxID=2026353 RepID=A0A853CKZ9_9ACTN|nr:GAF domain-containing SpoIIE family protein phosphatase [Petropleomorpha daqingensis]NYJ08066.1 serine phosphatase RsbU (regulator of sigma subunit) [Petropleomorpha daqingensis]
MSRSTPPHGGPPDPWDREALLRRVTEVLVSTLEPEQAAARLCDLVVPVLADWAVVTLIDEAPRSGRRRAQWPVASRHRDPARQVLAESYARARLDAITDDALLQRTIRTGRPEVVPGNATTALRAMLRPGQAHELLEALAPEHVLVLPLVGRSGAVGLLSLFNGAARGQFGAADLATASDVAARAGLVLDNARLYDTQRSLAEALQRSMLTAPPTIDGLEIAVRYTPAARAAEIGGDWYDCFVQHGGSTFVIGDVAGHDISAAAAMGQVRTLLRGIAVATQAGPGLLLDAVDTAMAELQVAALATAVVAHLSPPEAPTADGWRVRWANAGHPPPLLVQPDGRVALLDTVPELLLGAVPDVVRTESETLLQPGAVLLLYTDGLVETPAQSVDDGIALLHRTLTELVADGGAGPGTLTLEELCDGLLDRVMSTPPEDDVALLAVRPYR